MKKQGEYQANLMCCHPYLRLHWFQHLLRHWSNFWCLFYDLLNVETKIGQDTFVKV